MNDARVDKIVRAVMYEGYVLYPYRRSMKNHHRWTFGAIYPRAYTEEHGPTEPCVMQAECLVAGPAHARVRVTLRFLQSVNRTIGEVRQPIRESLAGREPAYREVPSLTIGQRVYHPWQETVEREWSLSEVALGALAIEPREESLQFDAARESQPLQDDVGTVVGLVLRERQPISGAVAATVQLMEPGLFKLAVRVSNLSKATGCSGTSRADALSRSLLSTHLILRVEQGEFVSLIDPPAGWRKVADHCRNVGTFPVLAGTEGETDAMISSPIILYDYPQVAPESAGDHFDACEIDELLAMRIRTLTDQEKLEMMSLDERTRELLERTESLSSDQVTQLHGAVRAPRDVVRAPFGPESEAQQKPGAVRVGGATVRAGDRVRLWPRGRADAFDMLLRGKVATVTSIEQDYENRVHLAVTLEDDPGADLGAAGKIGHRFFFLTDEVEPLSEEQAGRR